MSYTPKQRQTAQILVKLSDGKTIQDRSSWLSGDLPDSQTIRLHVKLVKNLLERHLGKVGNLFLLQDKDPCVFYNHKVKNTLFSSIRPMTNEPMFLYLTRLAKHLNAIEKTQLSQASRILASMKY